MFVFVCVFITLKGHSFYTLFIFPRFQGLAKLSSSLNLRNDGRRGISIAYCDSHQCYTSYVSIQDKRQARHCLLSCWCTTGSFLYWHATGSSFHAVAHKGLLSLLVFNWVFFTCCTSLISFLPWQAKNKKAKNKKKTRGP